MKLKLTCFTILIFLSAIAKAQLTPSQKVFYVFACKSDTLRMDAYKKRDAKAYAQLTTSFENEYKKLSTVDQACFKGNYNSAWYNLACVYSLLNDKENALNTLDKSIKLGFIWYKTITGDVDMNNIRNEPRFIAMVTRVREVNDYLYILKKAGKYNTADTRQVPQFTYQSATEPHLVELRKAFKLDSVAGKGNEVSQIISLLHWIHDLVPHDGQHNNPAVKNAMSMIAVCKKESRGLNCRGLATVLNECYLSMGFKSRFVTCFPKDSLKIDNDCHVINMVYARSLNKWIWIDPTNDAYVMDETGTLLGLAEVRERLVNDKPLIVNPDANWNHRQSTLKQDYLYNYMAKNLYILECPLRSEYDTETAGEGKKTEYVTLLPLDYFKQSPDQAVVTDDKNKYTKVFYKTNNPNLFWQLPVDDKTSASIR
ncbi:TPR end-of-group domain-containing protein [Mucilaginibacter sp. AW1-3]